MGEAIKARVHSLFGHQRTRPVLPIHERNNRSRPRIQFQQDSDPTPPQGSQRPRLPVKGNE
jgi:hypothetical protein